MGVGGVLVLVLLIVLVLVLVVLVPSTSSSTINSTSINSSNSITGGRGRRVDGKIACLILVVNKIVHHTCVSLPTINV